MGCRMAHFITDGYIARDKIKHKNKTVTTSKFRFESVTLQGGLTPVELTGPILTMEQM